MFELWVLDWCRSDGWCGWWCVFRQDQQWKVEAEAARWPKWQVEIVEAVSH